jgi:type IV secretion system protein VirB10
VSFIDSGTSAVAARLAGPSRGPTVFIAPAANATSEVVARAYDSTINTPPTLYVNQGTRIGVFVARDLSFKDVYGLERTSGEREERP